jgi:class 3 adenylate cyclase
MTRTAMLQDDSDESAAENRRWCNPNRSKCRQLANTVCAKCGNPCGGGGETAARDDSQREGTRGTTATHPPPPVALTRHEGQALNGIEPLISNIRCKCLPARRDAAELPPEQQKYAVLGFVAGELAAVLRAYAVMRNAVRNFARYVPRDIVWDLMWSNELSQLSMRPARCAMLFADVEGFTAMCARVDPARLSVAVQRYFELMTRIALAHGGIVDKYIGDCVMAVWGVPREADALEQRVALGALAMFRGSLSTPITQEFERIGEQLGIRVGAACGEVLAGNMGSTERMSYTVIGDAVNLAARLESLNKQWGTRVMLADDVARGCGAVLALRLVIHAAVVGRAMPLDVYDVAGALPPPADAALVTSSSDGDEAMGGSTLDDLVANTSRIGLLGRAGGRDIVPVARLAWLHAQCYAAPPATIRFCDAYSAAARVFKHGAFADCAAQLRSIVEGGSPSAIVSIPATPEYDARASVEKLLSLAQDFATEAPLRAFYRGAFVYNPVGK